MVRRVPGRPGPAGALSEAAETAVEPLTVVDPAVWWADAPPAGDQAGEPGETAGGLQVKAGELIRGGYGTRADTTWTFTSRAASGKEIPAGYDAIGACALSCRVEPLIFLRYDAGLGLRAASDLWRGHVEWRAERGFNQRLFSRH